MIGLDVTEAQKCSHAYNLTLKSVDKSCRLLLECRGRR